MARMARIGGIGKWCKLLEEVEVVHIIDGVCTWSSSFKS